MRQIVGFACALTVAVNAWAQSAKVYRVGLLETISASANRANLEALLRGLEEAGYVEGKNLVIDYRSADGRPERFPDIAARLVRAKPDVILARGTAATLAAKTAGSVPVVMTSSADPVGSRLAASFAKPGGTVTGVTSIVAELDAKRVEILQRLLPGAKRVAVMLNMGALPTAAQWKTYQQAAKSLGLEAILLDIRDVEALRRAFDQARAQGADALMDALDALSQANRRLVIELALTKKLPVIYVSREWVDAGGLISYGVHYPDLYYRAAGYVDKILKGAKPGDLAIERPRKLELVINEKAAKALGINVPRDLLLRADEVIR